MAISLVSPWCFLKTQDMLTSLIQNWGFEALVLDWDDDGPGSWRSCDGPYLWEIKNEGFFGLQNPE